MNRSQTNILLPLLLFLMTAGTFLNTLQNSFVWDDEQFILTNRFINSSSDNSKIWTENIVSGAGIQSNLYRPIQSWTHRLDMILWKQGAAGHHLSNVFFHSVLVVFIYFIFRKLFRPWTSFLCAGLFCLHPIQTEAVAFLSGRGDTLAMIFICLGLLLYERFYVLAMIAATASVLSKESACLFPAFLILFLYAEQKQKNWKKIIPFFIISATYIGLRLTTLNFQNTLNFYNTENILTTHPTYRLWTYLTTLPKGILLWIAPYDLHHERSWLIQNSAGFPIVWLSFLFLVALLTLALLLRKKSPVILVGFIWFIVATLPTSNLLVLINAIFYDHWFILPGIGLMMSLGFFLDNNKILRIFFVIIILVFGFISFSYNQIWKNPISLNSYLLRFEPDSAKIYNNLAMAYNENKDQAVAIRYYENAIQLDDHYPQTHHNLARSYQDLGNTEKAIEHYLKAVSMDKSFFHSWINLGIIYLRQKNNEEARACFIRAMETYPYAASAYTGLAQTEVNRGQKNKALAILHKGIENCGKNDSILKAMEYVQNLPES